MERDDVWRVIDSQKISLADQLQELAPDDWRRLSLCEGWTVRDVVAHLTLQNLTFGAAAVDVIRAHGSLNRAIHDGACRRAERPVEQLLADLRSQVGARRHPPGVTYQEVFVDTLVHGQDIAIPLGLAHPIPPAAAASAASRVWLMREPLLAKRKITPSTVVFAGTRRLLGLRFTATDVAWSVGDGPEVRGPIDGILLALTGRTARLSSLSGEGTRALTAELRGVS